MSINIELEMSSFNASITVTELLTKTLENCAKDLATRCIKECAQRHGFNAEEEIRTLGLENLTLIRKQMAKKSVSKSEPKKARAAKEKKSTFPLPFGALDIEIGGCRGLAFNRGLFTQCPKKRMDNGDFCSGCQTEADKNASGCPDCGTVDQRLSTGLYEFKDPKGRSPVHYVKVLNKLKLSVEQAVEEAGKLNMEIPNEHLTVVEKESKKKSSKGRPKKAVGAVEAENVSDLFAKLTAEGDEEMEFAEESEAQPKVVQKKAKLSDEEKAAKKAALEEERAQKKAEREAKLGQEKAEREEKRKADLEQKKAEREAKVAAEKAEREAKRLQEKEEKEAKKAAEKALAEQKKATKTKKADKEPVAVAVAAKAPVAAKVEEDVEPVATKVSVTRMQIGGKMYLKSSNNILYDPETREEIALWNPITKTMEELPEDDEDGEEEEEDYEEA